VGRMLRWRLLLSVVFISALVALCWLDLRAERPGIVLLPLALVAALLAAGELLAMFRKRGHQPLSWVVYGGVLVTLVAAAVPGLWPEVVAGNPIQGVGWLAIGFALSVLLAFASELRRFDGGGRATAELALAVFAIAYVGVLVGFLVQLRLFGGGSGQLGMHALLSMIAIVKMSDIGQYTAGRLFGKHKLAPVLSPGKTWEGVAGGALFACVAAWLVNEIAHHHEVAFSGAEWARMIAYALALVTAGIVGDLTESMLKRDAGVKDSSAWMPGFGGVLDLLDSLMGAAPVAYLFWAMGWVGV
jgi:phosphatidate cytidylyltransferase